MSLIAILLWPYFTVHKEIRIDRLEAQKAFSCLLDIRENPKNFCQDFPFLKTYIPPKVKLKWNDTLSKVAENKAIDLAQRKYFSHKDPDGYGINYFISQAGYKLNRDWTADKSTGYFESLCAGAINGQNAISLLINDYNEPTLGHRKHLLGIGSWYNSLVDVGIGFCWGDSTTPYKSYVCVIIAKHDW